MVANLYLTDKHPDVDLKASNTSTLVAEYPQPRFQHKENSIVGQRRAQLSIYYWTRHPVKAQTEALLA